MNADLVGLADRCVREADDADRAGVMGVGDLLREAATELRALAGAEVGGVPISDVAIAQGNYGQPDGSRIFGWRVSATTATEMGMSSMCLPREIGEDLERLRAIATWWETGAKERMAKLQLIIENSFPDDRILRRGLWDAILPLIHAIAPPPGSGRGGVNNSTNDEER